MLKRFQNGTAGAALTKNTFVYADSADGYRLKTQATASATTTVGVVEADYADEDAVQYVVEGPAVVKVGEAMYTGSGVAVRAGTSGHAFLADASTDVIVGTADHPEVTTGSSLWRQAAIGDLITITLKKDKTVAVP